MNKRFAGGLLATASLSLAIVGSAQANPIINFNQGNSNAISGTLAYGGSGGPANGSFISFTTISGESTPQHAGASNHLTCSDCVLNFTTGSNQSSPDNGTGTWTFNGGGTFTLIGSAYTQDGGCVAACNITADTQPLVSGRFTGTPSATRMNGTLTFSGRGTDRKNSSLLSYFGLGPYRTFDYATNTISTNSNSFNGSFIGTVDAANLTDTAVPEPQNLLMLIGGLLGIAFLKRKKQKG